MFLSNLLNLAGSLQGKCAMVSFFLSFASRRFNLSFCHDNFNIMLMLKQCSLHWIAKITLSSKIILKLWLLSKLSRIVSNPLLILCGIPWTSLGRILCRIICGIPWTDLGSVQLVMGPMWLADALVVGLVVWFVAWLSVWLVHPQLILLEFVAVVAVAWKNVLVHFWRSWLLNVLQQ